MEPLPLDPGRVVDFLAEVESADGFPPLSEHKVLTVTGDADGRAGAWGRNGRTLVAAAAARHPHPGEGERWAVEVAVHPEMRPDGEAEAIVLGTSLAPPDGVHTLWSFRDDQLAAAEALGYRPFRELVLLETDLPAAPPEPVAGYRLRSFRPGADEPDVVAVNNRAFVGHRENEAMTVESLERRQASGWFDPEGLLVAEGDGSVVAFCWTKVHPDGAGEIYIIGVDPGHHGRGLGRWIVLAGLDHLHRDRRCEVGRLWTEGDNAAAIHLYRSIGFRPRLINRELRLGHPNG